MNNKLKAFTIIEVTIAMMASAILILIVYTAFSIISNAYRAFYKKNNEISGLVQFDRLMNKDFSKAKRILRTERGVLLVNDTDSTIYIIDTAYIVRNHKIIDTFKVKVDSSLTLFENQPVSLLSRDTAMNRIDQLEIQLNFNNQPVNLQYHKTYSSSNLIQQDPYASH
jgi:Tfp pilus assembly protein PilE